MCCVIPPASVSTTLALRIASSSVVLPWSTWPMIVTTGGRGTRSSGSSSTTSGSASSSPACLIVTSRLSSAASSSTSSSVSDCVAVFRAPRPMRILMMSCIPTPSACEKSRTVIPDSRLTGPVGWTTSRGCFGGAAPALVARAAVVGTRPGGAGVDHDAAPAPRAAALARADRSLRPVSHWPLSHVGSVERAAAPVRRGRAAAARARTRACAAARSKQASRRQV